MTFAYTLLIALVLYAFRKRIWEFISEYYEKYKANKKRQALYDRLDRNAEGKFDQKTYLKTLDKQKKAQMKKNREKQEDAK